MASVMMALRLVPSLPRLRPPRPASLRHRQAGQRVAPTPTKVTVIPGDGVGPELMGHVERVFGAARVPVELEVVHVEGGAAGERGMAAAIRSVRRHRVGLKGNFETAVNLPGPRPRSRNVQFRAKLDLFASVNHYRSLAGVPAPVGGVDLVAVRETTEGEYTHLEHESVPGVVESLKIITRARSERVAEFAFDYARRHGRRSLAVVHKANIMKLSDGLFLQCCREVAAGYPDIAFTDVIVDNATMQLVSQPQQFDVLLMPNLYGVVVNNICAGLVGGPGLVAGGSFGQRCSVFQTAIRNTASGLANRNVANPTAMLLASCLMLDHLRLHGFAELIRIAVTKAVTEARIHTPDLGGTASSTDVVDYVVKIISTGGRVIIKRTREEIGRIVLTQRS
uniref:isocitrate dehydrogenase [NAD] subunit gamma, mitochondrial-like n=1 Tax=Pristiophorus japonicus TaxID=55135 RepID=UPI00398EC615